MRENKEFVLFENASRVHKCLLETLLSEAKQQPLHAKPRIYLCVCII